MVIRCTVRFQRNTNLPLLFIEIELKKIIKGFLFTYLKYLQKLSYIHPEGVILETDKKKIVLEVGSNFIIQKRDGQHRIPQILVEL